jgi:hypothetical protein
VTRVLPVALLILLTVTTGVLIILAVEARL